MRGEKKARLPWKRTARILLWIAFGFYLLMLLKLCFLEGRLGRPAGWRAYLSRINIVPFHSIVSYLQGLANGSINASLVWRNLLGNFVMLFPMGCFLPCLFRGQRQFGICVLTLLGIVFGIEAAQWMLCVGIFDIDDVILNFSGGVLGYAIVRLAPIRRMLERLGLCETAT